MKLSIFLFSILFFMACSADSENSAAVVLSKTDKQNSPSKMTILIFNKENTAEIWTDDPNRKIYQKLKLTISPEQLSPGIFENVDVLPLALKNRFEQSLKDNEVVKKVIVFPNDARPNGHFQPCFACPHSTTAVYASLEMHLKAYPLEK